MWNGRIKLYLTPAVKAIKLKKPPRLERLDRAMYYLSGRANMRPLFLFPTLRRNLYVNRFGILVAAMLLAIAGVVSAVGQSAPPVAKPQPEISAAKMALIKEYLDLTVGPQMNESIDQMLEMQKGFAKTSAESMVDGAKGLSPSERELAKQLASETVDRMMTRMQDFFKNEVDINQMTIDVAVPLLDRYFTEQDLTDLIVFYKSPIGQKSIKAAPSMMLEMSADIMQRLAPKMEKLTRSIVEEETTQLRDKIAKLGKKTAATRRRG